MAWLPGVLAVLAAALLTWGVAELVRRASTATAQAPGPPPNYRGLAVEATRAGLTCSATLWLTCGLLDERVPDYQRAAVIGELHGRHSA